MNGNARGPKRLMKCAKGPLIAFQRKHAPGIHGKPRWHCKKRLLIFATETTTLMTGFASLHKPSYGAKGH